MYFLCIFFVFPCIFFVFLCISNGNTDDACGSRVWERWSTIEGSIKCQAGAENIRKRYRAIQRDVALYRGRKYKETSDVGDGKYKRFGRRWRKPPSLPFPAPILSFLCFFYFQPFQRLWWSSNLTRYLSLKLYYSSTITTYSKVVVKMYYYNILLSCFQNIQGSTNCLRLSSGFYSLSPSLYTCGAVIGRKVAKSISEMALRLRHHHRRYLIESTCKRCVGVSEYFNEWYFQSRILCWQNTVFIWKKRHLLGDWASCIVKHYQWLRKGRIFDLLIKNNVHAVLRIYCYLLYLEFQFIVIEPPVCRGWIAEHLAEIWCLENLGPRLLNTGRQSSGVHVS